MKKTIYFGLDPSNLLDKEGLLHLPLIETRLYSLSKLEPFLKEGAFASTAILTSKQACHYLFSTLEVIGLKGVYVKKKYISVGKATSKVLKSYGIKNIETSFIETAEGVLDILRMCDLKKETFFYPHSELSRPLISDFLKPCRVTMFSLYTTKSILLNQKIKMTDYERFIFTSASTVDAFFLNFGSFVFEGIEVIAQGPQTKKRLLELYPTLGLEDVLYS